LAVAQPASKESAGNKPAPNPPAGAPLIQSEAPSPALQRKTCPCGGGCPKCLSPAGGAMLQTKLTVNTPGDAFELEADRVAEHVMRMPAAPGACPCGGGCPKCQSKRGDEYEQRCVQSRQSTATFPMRYRRSDSSPFWFLARVPGRLSNDNNLLARSCCG
jgi:hypothetical protein